MQMAVTLDSQVEFSEAYRDLVRLSSCWIAKDLPFPMCLLSIMGNSLDSAAQVFLLSVPTNRALQ